MIQRNYCSALRCHPPPEKRGHFWYNCKEQERKQMSRACRFHRLRGVHANGVLPFAPSGDRLHPTRPPHVEGGEEEAERGLHSCLHRKRQ